MVVILQWKRVNNYFWWFWSILVLEKCKSSSWSFSYCPRFHLKNTVLVEQLLALGNVFIYSVKCISATPETIQLKELTRSLCKASPLYSGYLWLCNKRACSLGYKHEVEWIKFDIHVQSCVLCRWENFFILSRRRFCFLIFFSPSIFFCSPTRFFRSVS